MKKKVFILTFILLSFSYMHANISALPEIHLEESMVEVGNNVEWKASQNTIDTKTVISDKQDKVDKPIPCVVIITVNGVDYVGYGEAFSEKEACDRAYDDAISQIE